MERLDVLHHYAPQDRGHVARHAELSKLLAREAGLSDSEIETTCRCSLLHEYGRIGFDYELRDRLLSFTDRYSSTDVLSRTTLVRRGLLPDWPTPDEVVRAIGIQLGEKTQDSRFRRRPEVARFRQGP